MTQELEFCLLGPMVIRRGGQVVPVPRGKQRALLAVLLLRAGVVVSVSELAEMLWGSVPPPSAPATIRNYVKRLRRVLGDADHTRIVTQPPGYLIWAGPEELDVARFATLLEGALNAARGGSWETAAQQARLALALWRGGPLADVKSEALALAESARLAELRLQALELRADADLHLGRYGAVIAELERVTADHPLREHLRALLMLALYSDGRQAEALAAYQEARRVLVAELGVEPGAELRELQRRILAGELARTDSMAGQPPPGNAGSVGTSPGQMRVRPRHVVPRELPGPVRHFVGRVAELADLTAMLERASAHAPRTLAVSVITGTPGVGKTALAVQWAHQVADRFPDGQLYVNLRGYDPGQPMRAGDALTEFLRALGMAGLDAPASGEERAALYRSLLATRRMLVLLDNAQDCEQVRPLLPGPSCVTVVTSRDALAGLVARDGAHRLDLGLLPSADAAVLLRALLGDRVDAEPEAAATLARQCAQLPLALRVAAERAAAFPGVPLASLAAELADHQCRLDLLDTDGDDRTAVRAVFSWSVRHLEEDAARTFRLLGLHPGAGFDAYAAAALTGTTLGASRRQLRLLARAGLVQPSGTDRYGMHDLLRAYAADLATGQHGERERRAALTRLFDHYLATAAAAAAALFPDDPDRLEVPQAAIPGRPLGSAAAALEWLDTERANLVAVAGHSAAHGWPGHAIGLAATIFRYPDIACFDDAAAAHHHARRAAVQTGDRGAEAGALTMLGAAEAARGRLQQAKSYLEHALALCRAGGDRGGEARVLGNLGVVRYCQGRYQQAAQCHHKALALCREAGDRAGEARARLSLGVLDLRQGRHQQAAAHLHRSLVLFREAGICSGEAYALASLGELALRRGHFGQAARHLQRSLGLCREIGSRHCEALALSRLGITELRQNRHQQAAGHLNQSLTLHSEAGNRSGQADTLNGLGEALLATGHAHQAWARHADALALAIEAADRYEQARAHSGLASACQATGNSGQADHHRQQALAECTELGIPETELIRSPPAPSSSPGAERAVR